MIEKFMILMIHELGPTGLLIAGLYFLLSKHMEKLCGHIATMNHNSAKLIEKLDSAVDRICDKIDSKK